MDRYRILLKKKPESQGLFPKKIREIFGTKYPIKIILVPWLKQMQMVTSIAENFLYYEIENHMFVPNQNLHNNQIPVFQLKYHENDLKAAFKAAEGIYQFKAVNINRLISQLSHDFITVELVIANKKEINIGAMSRDHGLICS